MGKAKRLKEAKKKDTIKAGRLFQVQQAVNKIDPHGTLEVEIDTAMQLNEVQKTLSNLLESFEKARVKLAEKHAEKDKDGKPVLQGRGYKMSDFQGFEKDFEKISDKDIEGRPAKFSRQDMKNFGKAGVKLSRFDLAVLEIVIEE